MAEFWNFGDNSGSIMLNKLSRLIFVLLLEIIRFDYEYVQI